MKAKTLGWLAGILALAAACLLAGDFLSHPIGADGSGLTAYLQDRYRQGTGVKILPAISLYGSVAIGSREYWLLEMGEDLGSVTLERGLTGRYRVVRFGYGTGNFCQGIVEQEGRKYLLYGGRDITCRIARIAVSIHGRTYQLHNEKGADHFFLSTEIDPQTPDDAYVDLELVRLYDWAGEDITGLYELGGGGIQ